MISLKDRTAIVTGGISGIGAETTRLFHELGARVLCTDIASGGEGFASQFDDNVAFAQHDISRADQWTEVIERAEKLFGNVSILVNNAGIVGELGLIQDVNHDVFRRVVDVNLFGTFYGMQAIVPSMRRAGGGSIVNTSSVAGLFAIPNHFAYVASKFAVTGMTKAAAVDLGQFGIRVNSVHPGAVATPLATRMGVDEVAVEVTKNFPIPRVGSSREMANVIAFLASDASSYCTAGSFVADAGWTAT